MPAATRWPSPAPSAFPIIGNRPYITQYDDWRAPIEGEKFDPYVDRFFKPPTIGQFLGR